MEKIRLYGGLKFKMALPSPDTPIQKVPPPETVILPLSDRPGIYCRSLVERGERVFRGERIGEDPRGLMLPIHSPVSGHVTDIKTYRFAEGGNALSIFIASDGLDEWTDLTPVEDFTKESPLDLVTVIRNAGVKIIPFEVLPEADRTGDRVTPIRHFVINGIEHGLLGSVARRLLVERPRDLVRSVRLIQTIFRPETVYLVINKRHSDVLQAVSKSGLEKVVTLLVLDVYYPLGHPHLLFKSIFKKEIPFGAKAIDLGTAFSNVDTLIHALEAVDNGSPMMERYVTVLGEGIRNPRNLRVRIGTPIRELVEFCGGFQGTPGRIALGNPLDGMAQFSLDRPVLKDTRRLWVQPEREVVKDRYRACINCGQCIDVCPMRLMPNLLGKYCEFLKFDEAMDRFDLRSCIDCGLCAYVCPSRRPLVHFINFGKRELTLRERAHER